MATALKGRVLELRNIFSSPLYFLEYVKILDPIQGAISFEVWPHLAEAVQLFLREKRIVILKARQIGFSWLAAAYAVWTIYTKRGARVLVTSMGEDEAKEFLEKCKFIYHNLPERMKFYSISPDSTEAFGFDKTLSGQDWNSRIVALPSTENAGSGYAATLVIADELDKHRCAAQNFRTIKPTVDAGGQYIGIFTVDKSNPDSFAKNLYKDAEKGLNGFSYKFYDWRNRPGRDDEWYQKQKTEYISLPDKGLVAMESEYPNSAQEALAPMSAVSCFNKDALQTMWDNAVDVNPEKGFIYRIMPPKPGYIYGAGVDVGEGVGLDYSALTIVGSYGLRSEVVALIYSNQIATDAFAYEVDKLCREYYTPLLVVENNAIGVAVINKLIEFGYPKLYKEPNREKYGWASSGRGFTSKRYTVFQELVPKIDSGHLVTRFKPQIQEMMEMQYVNGKPEPTGKTHGDTVISLMLANMAIKENKPVQKATVYYPRRERSDYGFRNYRY